MCNIKLKTPIFWFVFLCLIIAYKLTVGSTVNKLGSLLENIKTKYQALLLPVENQLNEINKSLEASQKEISTIFSKTEEIGAKILTEQENLVSF